MVGCTTDISLVTDSISIEVEYGVVVCDSIEVTDWVVAASIPEDVWADVPYFLRAGFLPQITQHARGPPA